MIRNIQLSHGGKYVCLIDTDVESLSTSAILVVKGTRATWFLECVCMLVHEYTRILPLNWAIPTAERAEFVKSVRNTQGFCK